jgi:hypothetical protein
MYQGDWGHFTGGGHRIQGWDSLFLILSISAPRSNLIIIDWRSTTPPKWILSSTVPVGEKSGSGNQDETNEAQNCRKNDN